MIAGSQARADTIVNVSTEAELRSAFNAAGPGTTIVLADGTYVLSGILDTRTGGNSSGYITVKAAHQKMAIIDSNGFEEAFHIDQPYWWFEGLFVKITHGSIHGYKIDTNGHHTRVRLSTMEIQPGGESGVKGAGGGVSGPWPDNVTIEWSEIYMTSPTTYFLAEGVDAVGVSNWILRDNTVHDIRTSAGGVAYGLMTKGNSQNTIMERNKVYNCFIGLSLGGGGTASQYMRYGDPTYEERNGMLRNNIVSSSTDVAIYIYQANGARIYNNTIYNSFTSCGTGCSAIDVRVSGATADIRNNILDKGVNDREGGTHTMSSNLIVPSATCSSWFVNATTRDFRLRAGVPAIDVGETLPQVSSDIYKRGRPLGLAFDVGAVERMP